MLDKEEDVAMWVGHEEEGRATTCVDKAAGVVEGHMEDVME